MGRTANQLLLGAGGADVTGGPFTPVDLFDGGLKGVFYNFSDASTLAQVGGSLGDVGNGDDIGTVADLSGNGVDLTQATLSKAPTWDSTRKTATFDGNDVLGLTGLGIVDDEYTFIIGMEKIATNLTGKIVFETNNGYTSDDGGFYFVDESIDKNLRFSTNTNAASSFGRTTAVSGDLTADVGNLVMFAVEVNLGGATEAAEIPVVETNGAAGSISPLTNWADFNSNVYTGTANLGGRGTTPTFPYIGDIAFLFIREGAIGATNRALVQDWANGIWSEIPAS